MCESNFGLIRPSTAELVVTDRAHYHQFIYLFYLSIHLLIYFFFNLFIYLFIYPFIYLFILIIYLFRLMQINVFRTFFLFQYLNKLSGFNSPQGNH